MELFCNYDYESLEKVMQDFVYRNNKICKIIYLERDYNLQEYFPREIPCFRDELILKIQ